MLSYPYFCLCMTPCYCIKQLQLQLFTSYDQTLTSATIVLCLYRILTFVVIVVSIGGSKGVLGMPAPLRSNFFYLHAFFAKKFAK